MLEKNIILHTSRNVKVAEMLIETGADVNAAYSPQNDLLIEMFGLHMTLECAESMGNEEVVKFLKEVGAEG